jgi:hypothetical protein
MHAAALCMLHLLLLLRACVRARLPMYQRVSHFRGYQYSGAFFTKMYMYQLLLQ